MARLLGMAVHDGGKDVVLATVSTADTKLFPATARWLESGPNGMAPGGRLRITRTDGSLPRAVPIPCLSSQSGICHACVHREQPRRARVPVLFNTSERPIIKCPKGTQSVFIMHLSVACTTRELSAPCDTRSHDVSVAEERLPPGECPLPVPTLAARRWQRRGAIAREEA